MFTMINFFLNVFEIFLITKLLDIIVIFIIIMFGKFMIENIIQGLFLFFSCLASLSYFFAVRKFHFHVKRISGHEI